VKRATAIAITGKLTQVAEVADRRLGRWPACSEIVEVVWLDAKGQEEDCARTKQTYCVELRPLSCEGLGFCRAMLLSALVPSM
jgi:hypothetical protein